MAMLTAVRRRRAQIGLLDAVVPAQRRRVLAPGGVMRDPQLLVTMQAPAARPSLGRALQARSADRAARLDAEGKAKVADMLGQLDARWRVLHAVQLGDGSSGIDHVVIGPGGVFALSSHHHPGGAVLVAGDLFMVDGRRYTYPESARRAADGAATRLTAACGIPVAVSAVVVPVGADDFLIKRAPAAVGIVTRARVNRWLADQKEILSAAEIAQIYTAARRSDVWQ